MAKTRHTPGPWVVEEGLHGSLGVWAGERLIAGMEYRGEQPRKDAALIAAAPELLEAASGLLKLIGHGEGDPFKPDAAGTYNERVEALFVAIAKAEGR